MKTLNLRFFISLLIISVSLFSCSKDDEGENQPDLSEVNLLFFDEENTISPPEGLTNNSNMHAVLASIQATYFSNVGLHAGFFQIPTDADNSAPITAKNGRVAENIQTYVYGYGDAAVAYQVTDRSSEYFFELFIKYEGEDYIKIYEAIQKKDGSEASFSYLDEEADERTILLSWVYKKTSDGYTIKYIDESSNTTFELQMHNDQSGSIVSKEDGVLSSEYTWDAVGNGTYKYYDSEGILEDSGSWEAAE